jgi:hypothetical protein
MSYSHYKSICRTNVFPIVVNYSKNHIGTTFIFQFTFSLPAVPKSKERSGIKVSSRFDNSPFYSFSVINVQNANQDLELQSCPREP